MRKYSDSFLNNTTAVSQNVSNLMDDIRAEDILKSAPYYIDAKNSLSSTTYAENLGTAKEILPTSFYNSPKYLDWSGTNYIYIPGIGSNSFSGPLNDSALVATTDIDYRIKIASTSYTPSSNQMLVYTYFERFGISGGAGYPYFQWNDGTNWLTSSSTTSLSSLFSAGQTIWLRMTFVANNGAGGNDAKFYYSTDDAATWTQLGSTVTKTGTSQFNSNVSKTLGFGAQDGNAYVYDGKIYKSKVYINGSLLYDIDTSVIKSGSDTTFKALTGQTMTINRSSTPEFRTVAVTQPCWLTNVSAYSRVANLFMEHTGVNYLYLPGSNGNYASSPDSNALDITGDLDVRVKVALDDWTPGSPNLLLAKWTGSGNYSYYLYINGGGAPSIQWSPNGTDSSKSATGATLNLKDGSIKWVRWVLDVDNGAGGNDNKFYTSDDGINWTQLGSTITQSGTTSIYAGTAPLELGSYNGGNTTMTGKLYRAQVFNGIGGTLAFDANFESGITSGLQTTFVESSSNAATVTINRASTWFRSYGVTSPGYLYTGATNGFISSSKSFFDIQKDEGFTAVVVCRLWFSQPTYAGSLGKYGPQWAAAGSGFMISNWGVDGQVSFTVSDGTNSYSTSSVQTSTYSSGELSVFGGIKDRKNNNIYMTINGLNSSSLVSTPLLGDVINDSLLGINSWNGGYVPMELYAAAIFNRTLSNLELKSIYDYFTRRSL